MIKADTAMLQLLMLVHQHKNLGADPLSSAFMCAHVYQALLAYLESGRLAGTGSPGGSGGAQKNIFARLTFGLITKKADSEGPSEADVARCV